MDIKEIALKFVDSLRNKIDGISHMQSNQGLVAFAEALISAYKAELLKEAGEPGAYQVGNSYPRLDGTLAKIVGIGNQTVVDDEGCHYYNRAQDRGRVRGTAHDYSYPRNLVRYYTSDQVAAAIIKATKPLEDQLAKANQLWQVAQGRCDGLEEKLAKAEQRVAEWQPIETAPKDGTDMLCCGWRYNQPKNDWFHTVCWWNGHGFVDDSGYVDFVTHWMPLPKAPANGASS